MSTQVKIVRVETSRPPAKIEHGPSRGSWRFGVTYTLDGGGTFEWSDGPYRLKRDAQRYADRNPRDVTNMVACMDGDRVVAVEERLIIGGSGHLVPDPVT